MTRIAIVSLVALGCVGCGDGDVPAPAQCEFSGERAHGAVLTALAFTREESKGVAPGFDLDGLVSTNGDPQSCGKKDLVDPDGVPGIDNQLALLVPDVEQIVGGNAVDGLVQGAIDDGQLVILLEMTGVEDLHDDACIDLSVQVGDKTHPSIGTDGVIEAYQTWDVDPQSPRSVATHARISGGKLVTDAFELAVPIAIFDVAFTVHLHHARLAATIDDQGTMKGYFGGGLVPQEIADGVKNGAGLEDIVPLVKVAMNAAADLAHDDAAGVCTQMSGALAFQAKPAFLRR